MKNLLAVVPNTDFLTELTEHYRDIFKEINNLCKEINKLCEENDFTLQTEH